MKHRHEIAGGASVMDLATCRLLPLPDLGSLDVGRQGRRMPPEHRADARVQAWGRALQAALGDPRPLRPDRIWVHPSDEAALDAWVSGAFSKSERRGRGTRHYRDWHLYAWVMGCAPSRDPSVPQGYIAIEPDAHEPPRGWQPVARKAP